MTFLSSRKFGALLLTLGVLAVEVAFAWLSSRAYGALLHSYVGMWELEMLQWAVFLTLAVFGFVLATHRRYGVAALYKRGKAGAGVVIAVAVMVTHDWGAAIYTILGAGQEPTPALVLVTVSLCALALMPFLTAHLLLALAE